MLVPFSGEPQPAVVGNFFFFFGLFFVFSFFSCFVILDGLGGVLFVLVFDCLGVGVG